MRLLSLVLAHACGIGHTDPLHLVFLVRVRDKSDPPLHLAVLRHGVEHFGLALQHIGYELDVELVWLFNLEIEVPHGHVTARLVLEGDLDMQLCVHEKDANNFRCPYGGVVG